LKKEAIFTSRYRYYTTFQEEVVSWCSRLSRLLNTQTVGGSSPPEIIFSSLQVDVVHVGSFVLMIIPVVRRDVYFSVELHYFRKLFAEIYVL
jgi:hypothetical protein